MIYGCHLRFTRRYEIMVYVFSAGGLFEEL